MEKHDQIRKTEEEKVELKDGLEVEGSIKRKELKMKRRFSVKDGRADPIYLSLLFFFTLPLR